MDVVSSKRSGNAVIGKVALNVPAVGIPDFQIVLMISILGPNPRK